MDPPAFPVGEFEFDPEYSDNRRDELTDALRQAPAELGEVVQPLNAKQLDTVYRNWTIRQIVHHVADSHLHVYVRFKWTLTENEPRIKAYDEGLWSDLAEARLGDVGPSLALLTALHRRWVQLIETLHRDDFHRNFHHPEFAEPISLWECMNYYPWHARHHTGQIQWLVEQHAW